MRIRSSPDFGGSVPGARYVAMRFTAVKKAATTAAVWIDDVFVDPRMRRVTSRNLVADASATRKGP